MHGAIPSCFGAGEARAEPSGPGPCLDGLRSASSQLCLIGVFAAGLGLCACWAASFAAKLRPLGASFAGIWHFMDGPFSSDFRSHGFGLRVAGPEHGVPRLRAARTGPCAIGLLGVTSVIHPTGFSSICSRNCKVVLVLVSAGPRSLGLAAFCPKPLLLGLCPVSARLP